jgi:origin recognition complex subunit 6
VKATAQNVVNLGDTVEAPEFTMPSIRKLCKAFSTPLLAPHVYTGACTVLKLAGLWPRPDTLEDDDHEQVATEVLFKDKAMGVIIALYLMTLTRMQTAKLTTTVYKSTVKRSVDVLNHKPGVSSVEEWIRLINREGYCVGQEWWASVPESVFDFDPENAQPGPHADEEEEEVEENDDDDQILSVRKRRNQSSSGQNVAEDKEDPEDLLLPGLATMMQDAVDFLSDHRRREYATWSRDFLKKLDKLDKPSRTRATVRGSGSTRAVGVVK